MTTSASPGPLEPTPDAARPPNVRKATPTPSDRIQLHALGDHVREVR